MCRNDETLVCGLEYCAGGGLISPGKQEHETIQVPALVALLLLWFGAVLVAGLGPVSVQGLKLLWSDKAVWFGLCTNGTVSGEVWLLCLGCELVYDERIISTSLSILVGKIWKVWGFFADCFLTTPLLLFIGKGFPFLWLWECYNCPKTLAIRREIALVRILLFALKLQTITCVGFCECFTFSSSSPEG